MKRSKQRKFRPPTPMYFFPIRFALENLIGSGSVEYDGPLLSGEIGTIDGFRIIETVLR